MNTARPHWSWLSWVAVVACSQQAQVLSIASSGSPDAGGVGGRFDAQPDGEGDPDANDAEATSSGGSHVGGSSGGGVGGNGGAGGGTGFWVRVSRAEGDGDYEVVAEVQEQPYSLLPLEMTWDVDTGMLDPCTDRLPGGVSVVAEERDPAGGRFVFRVAGLSNTLSPPQKRCVVTLVGAQNDCQGTGREYGVGLYVAYFDNDGDYEDTMRLEAWHDTNGDCTPNESDQPGVEESGFPWEAQLTYRIKIEYN